MKVFVYGTLRTGEENAYLLNSAERLKEQAYVQGALYDTGAGYPAAVEEEGKIYGEVYEVGHEDLVMLDYLEGYVEGRQNNLFERKIRSIKADGKMFGGYVYLMNKKQPGFQKILFGDWKMHRMLRDGEEFLYFAYGSCMDTKRLDKAGMLHHFSRWEAAVLPNYSLTFSCRRIDGSRADIREDNGEVEGLLYILSDEAAEYLFRREGLYSSVYRPVIVQVEDSRGNRREALTFTAVDKQDCSAPPRHYAEEILRGAERGLSKQYINKINMQLENLYTL
ncbi:gamma-glutamylcyclotransferase [Alkalicoccus saliphilus]|uniref:Gamma-glutamylcyclotransferase n=1 Tax=Alkalicoccus saliphilus TaxID=200989 RepID=A0A2T4U845_9BACI|nr:gamma-glutamylcyclotransferase family protein [Alkalicoccus saliphilus]PTL39573.1 gamma-glutamylcyclotransferase [Alkalicoccus saliphilus]